MAILAGALKNVSHLGRHWKRGVHRLRRVDGRIRVVERDELRHDEGGNQRQCDPLEPTGHVCLSSAPEFRRTIRNLPGEGAPLRVGHVFGTHELMALFYRPVAELDDRFTHAWVYVS